MTVLDPPKLLLDKAALVNGAVEDLLPDLDPADFQRALAGYHGGKARPRDVLAIYEPILHTVRAGGKRIRPALCMLACEAVGGGDRALATSVGVELIHTFTLVHDDIMDNDLVRRGQPTVQALWGAPVAITVGDGLFSVAFHAIAENLGEEGVDPGNVVRVLDLAAETCLKVCEGQMLDMTFEGRGDLTVPDYLEMVQLKTGALLEFSLTAGALIGGGTDAQVEALGRYGAPVGMAFQIRDDLLDLTADEDRLGKPTGSDIRAGKRTLMVVHALEHAPREAQERLLAILDKDEDRTTGEEVDEAIGILESAGSLDAAAKLAERLTADAKAALDEVGDDAPGPEAVRALRAMADYIVGRES